MSESNHLLLKYDWMVWGSRQLEANFTSFTWINKVKCHFFLHNIITVKFFEDVIGQFIRKKPLSLLMQKQVSLVVCGLIIEHCALSGVLIPQK